MVVNKSSKVTNEYTEHETKKYSNDKGEFNEDHKNNNQTDL